MKQVAMVVSTYGYHWQEVFDAYFAFRDHGCKVNVFTVNGRPPTPDPYSLKLMGPLALLGLGVSRRIAPTTERGKVLLAELASPQSVVEFPLSDFDALYLPGGHGCLFDINRNSDLHLVIERMYERGAILSAVCHATSTFAFVKSNGASIVSGHSITGFPKRLDQVLTATGAVHEKFLPLPFHNEDALRSAGARVTRRDRMKALLIPSYMRVSLPFVTGVGPRAAERVAVRVARELNRRIKQAEKLESRQPADDWGLRRSVRA